MSSDLSPTRLLCIVLLMAVAMTSYAVNNIPCIPRSKADSLSTQLVTYKDEIHPLNTLATDFTRKVCGQRYPYGYTPEQVVASWATYPEIWNRAPLLLIDSEELQKRLGITGELAAITQLYDSTTYRLQTLLDTLSPTENDLIDDIKAVDERVRLVGQLISGELIQPAPPGTTPPAAWQLQLEILNNHFHLFDILYGLVLILITIAFIVYIRRPNNAD